MLFLDGLYILHCIFLYEFCPGTFLPWPFSVLETHVDRNRWCEMFRDPGGGLVPIRGSIFQTSQDPIESIKVKGGLWDRLDLLSHSVTLKKPFNLDEPDGQTGEILKSTSLDYEKIKCLNTCKEETLNSACHLVGSQYGSLPESILYT